MALQIFSLLLLAAVAGTAPAHAQEIEFMDNGALLKCPSEVLEWYTGETANKQANQTLMVEAQLGTVKGQFSCKYKLDGNDFKHMFYINAKVCKNCVEFDGVLVLGVIIGDLLVTGGVILIVYKCATKNSAKPQQKASNPRSSNPPRPPNPDYAPLNPSTMSSGLYAGINKT